MVNFSLNFSEDVKTLNVSVEIDDDHKSNYYIDSVHVDYYKNVKTIGVPSDKAYKLYPSTQEGSNEVQNEYDLDPVTSFEGTLSESQINPGTHGFEKFKNGMFYVIVVCKNNDDQDGDEFIEHAAILDMDAAYHKCMSIVDHSIIEMKTNRCVANDGLVCSMMMYNAIKMAFQKKDYKELSFLWSRFMGIYFKNSESVMSICNCI